MKHYDLCVIGSGPAGQKAAIQAAKLLGITRATLRKRIKRFGIERRLEVS